MEDYLQDFDLRIMKQKAMNILKQDYLISTLHKISGELILKFHIQQYKANEDVEEKYIYQKDLERELESKISSICKSENELENLTSKTHANFEAYITSLNLPQGICKDQFEFLKPEEKPDLVYVYYPVLKGSKILKKSDIIEDELFEQEFFSK